MRLQSARLGQVVQLVGPLIAIAVVSTVGPTIRAPRFQAWGVVYAVLGSLLIWAFAATVKLLAGDLDEARWLPVSTLCLVVATGCARGALPLLALSVDEATGIMLFVFSVAVLEVVANAGNRRWYLAGSLPGHMLGAAAFALRGSIGYCATMVLSWFVLEQANRMIHNMWAQTIRVGVENAELNNTVRREHEGLQFLNERLHHQMAHDQLTGLLNRHGFALALNELPREHVAVMYIDIDHFKSVNVSFGQDIGDRVLRVVADRLRHCLGENAVVGRRGGDEFMAFVAVDDEAEAQTLGTQVRSLLRGTTAFGAVRLSLTVSIGLAVRAAGESVEDLLRRADLAVRTAKDDGRDGVVVARASQRSLAQARIASENFIRHAHETDQFVPWLQPVFTLDGRLVGAEVLTRWDHPHRGILCPDDFFPQLEELGMLGAITARAQEKAVEYVSHYVDALPRDFRLRLNVDAASLGATEFRRFLAHLEVTGYPARRICLEFTESAMVERSHQLAEVLALARQHGCHVELDDFGTGSSSLTLLKDLHVDGVKIDRSFVQTMLDEPRTMVLVASLAGLAKNLGIHVVAEGIESSDQLLVLQQLGVEYGQGYLLGRPKPLEQLELRLLRTASR